MKKKIAIIIDSKGWAFDIIANNIKKYILDYEIDIIPGEYFKGNMIKLFLFCKDYDLIHFMWRGYLSLINREELVQYVKTLGMSMEIFKEKYIYSKTITFTVCDELYLDGEEKWRTEEIMKFANAYFVTSKRLFDIYSTFEKKPETIIHDGVDLKLFSSKKLNRLKDFNRTIVVGWAGNSKFVGPDGDADLKGVEGIIKPAIQELKNQNYNISLKIADRNTEKIAIEKMPDYYDSIDIYVCASKREGTPMPILEAMAMGIPIVSTNVGIVQEAFGKIEKNYILEERTIECLVDKLKKIIDNPEQMLLMSEENLNQIKEWDWSVISKKYKDFFEKNIK